MVKEDFLIILGRPKFWFMLFVTDIDTKYHQRFIGLQLMGDLPIWMLKEASLPTFEDPSVNLATDSTQLYQQVEECNIKKFKKSCWFTLTKLQPYPLKTKKGVMYANVYFNFFSKAI